MNGLLIKGQVRHIQPISVAGEPAYILAKNNDSTRIIRFDPDRPASLSAGNPKIRGNKVNK